MGSEAEVEQMRGSSAQGWIHPLTSPSLMLADDAPLQKRKSRLRGRGKKPSPKEMEKRDGRNESVRITSTWKGKASRTLNGMQTLLEQVR